MRLDIVTYGLTRDLVCDLLVHLSEVDLVSQEQKCTAHSGITTCQGPSPMVDKYGPSSIHCDIVVSRHDNNKVQSQLQHSTAHHINQSQMEPYDNRHCS